jgi:hypothetical protein
MALEHSPNAGNEGRDFVALRKALKAFVLPLAWRSIAA